MVGLAVVAVPVLATRSPTAAAVIPAPDIDAPALGQEAVDLEARMAVHLFAGQVLGDTFATAQKDPTQIVGTSGGGDSALWSGVYLAAESFRYAVAKRAVAVAHTGNVRHAAEAELAAAKARIDDLAFSAHRRISISGDWKATPCSADHVPTVGDANQSCGLADSQAGAAFRQCQPVGVPAYVQDQSPSRPAMIFGPIRWHEDGKDYYCEDGSSRDVYAGTTYGLLTAFDLVGPDDAVLRDRIRDDVISMTSYLVSHGWSVVRPHTTVSTSGSENFVFPLFVINPEPRLNMMTAARHVADVAGTPADQAQWDALYDTELALDGPQLPGEFELAIASPHNSYYNFNLNHLTAFNTIRLAPNPVARDYLARQFAIIDATTRDDINAHFEAITYALTGEPVRRQLAVEHLTDWITYRNTSDQAVTNSTRCGQDLTCVGADDVDLHVETPLGPQTVTAAQTGSGMRAADPLSVVQRPRGEDFLWQRSPYTLDGASHANEEQPGVDFLMPYWMLRYAADVSAPAYAPLPPYVGPTAGGPTGA